MSENSERTKPPTEPDHYYDIKYDSKERFCSYWHQITEIISLNPEKTLEIGIGNRLVSTYLKERGIRIITLDTDKRLKPDVVGSVLEIPFTNESYDVVACYEVLEHLPYKYFIQALKEIHRISREYANLSLPHASSMFKFDLHIPKIGKIRKLIPLPTLRFRVNHFGGEHYWEISRASYPIKKIMSDIRNAGFNIRKTYKIFESPFHRIFLLEKN